MTPIDVNDHLRHQRVAHRHGWRAWVQANLDLAIVAAVGAIGVVSSIVGILLVR